MLALSLVSGSAFSQEEVITVAATEAARVSNNSQLFALQSQISALQHELQQLRGASEEISHATQALKGRQRDLYLDLDRRIRLLETNQQAPASIRLPGASSVAPSETPYSSETTELLSKDQATIEPAEATPSADPALVKETYQNALSLLKDKRYEKAMVGFRSFVQTYPSDDLADNAQYWLASTLYVIGEYDLALDEYQNLINNYTASNKYSEGLLKIAYIYQQKGKLSEATQLLKQITSDYPDSTVGRLAERRLQKIANP